MVNIAEVTTLILPYLIRIWNEQKYTTKIRLVFQKKFNIFFYQIEEEMLGGLRLLKVLTKAFETQTSNQWVQRLWFVHRCALIFVMMGVYSETPL